MTEATSVIDDPDTWPGHVREVVVAVAENLRASTEYVADLDVPEDDAETIHRALVGSTWRIYHCTRILVHEREDVLVHGLAPASDALVDRKLADAVAHGHLTVVEASELRQSHMLRPIRGQRQGREGRICALTTRVTLGEYHGLWRLFEHWGGELVYFDQPDSAMARLRDLGTPSIVVIDLPLTAPPSRGWYPPIERLLIGTVLGMDGVYGETNQRVAGTWPVTDIWQPGHPDYDRHDRLPQT